MNGNLLIAAPPIGVDIHSQKAWTIISALKEETSITVVNRDQDWNADDIWAGLVFNSEGDMLQCERLRNRSRPCVYFPGIGPVENGAPCDRGLHETSHRLAIRLKMQIASAVLMESFVQTRTAQSHYGVNAAWVVIPPCVHRTEYERLPVLTDTPPPPREIAVVGAMDDRIRRGIDDWRSKKGLSLVALKASDAVLSTPPGGTSDRVIVWLDKEFYGDSLVATMARGVRLAALDYGLIDPNPVLAEWLSPGCETEELSAALEAAMGWSAGRTRAQANWASEYAPSDWVKTLLSVLRRLRLSPAPQFAVV